MVSNPTARERRQSGVRDQTAVIIDSVEPDSPAEGVLQVGDVVTQLGGQTVLDSDSFVRLIGELPVGRPIPIELRRNGKAISLDVTTRKRQLPSVAVTRDTQRLRWRGMLLGPIPANWDFSGPRPARGVMVLGVDVNSPAVKEGIQAGAVITAIGGRQVADVVELQRIINEIPPEQWHVEIAGGSNAAVASGSP
jgi:serine protease Do